MIESLSGLGAMELKAVADALSSGRLAPPFSALAVRRHVDDGDEARAVAEALQQLSATGWSAGQMAALIAAVGAERCTREAEARQVDLVWSGPESVEAPSRDTAVVVRQLFKQARRSVLVAGYVVYQGRRVFETLGERMQDSPDLEVRMFLDVQRHPTDTSRDEEVLARFSRRFREKEWPGLRLPEVYYDPRSLALEPGKRSCLHAKCIVVDREVAFVSSANFTEAAQERNIEVGALIRAPGFAEHVARQFEGLVREKILCRLPLV